MDIQISLEDEDTGIQIFDSMDEAIKVLTESRDFSTGKLTISLVNADVEESFTSFTITKQILVTYAKDAVKSTETQLLITPFVEVK